jgi:hypothetical protein
MSTNEHQTEIQAEAIVEAIMPTQNTERPITRIALMSGRWPNDERNEGGLNRQALLDLVRTVLTGGKR